MLPRISRVLYRLLSEHPVAVIAVVVAAFFLSFGAFAHVEIDEDFEAGISDARALEARRLYQQHFESEQAVLIAFPIDGLTRETLLSLWELSDELQRLPETAQVMSILDLLRPCRTLEEFSLYLKDFRLRNLGEIIRRTALLRGFLISADLRAIQLLVIPNVRIDHYRSLLYTHINEIISRRNGQAQAHVFGFPYVQQRFFEFIAENNKRFLTIGFIGCAILAWFLFPDPVILLLILFAIAAPTAFTFAVYFMNGNKINLFTSPIIPFTLIISLNEIIYIVSFFAVEMHHAGQSYLDLHKTNFQKLIRPCMINTLTTLIGFLSLSQSPSPSIRLFALYTSLACLFAYLVTFGLIFAFLRLYQPRFSLTSRPSFRMPHLTRFIKHLVFRHPGKVLAITTIGIMLSGFSLMFYERRNALTDNFAADDPLVASHAFISRHFGGPFHFQVLITHPQLMSRERLASIAAFQRRIERLPHIDRTYSIVDLVLGFQQEFTGDRELPRSEELTQAIVRLFAPRGLSELFINPAMTVTLLRVTTPLTDDFQIEALQTSIMEAASATLPVDMRVEVTGDVYLNAVMQKNILENITWSFGAAIVMIIGTFWLVFRRFSMAFIALVVNFAPIGAAYAVVRLFGIPLNPSTAVVGCVMSGLIVDDTLHLLTFYADSRQPTTLRRLLATMRELSSPVSSSSILLALGNAVFLFSPFKPFQYFGLIGTLVVGIGLVGDLVILPALLLVFSRTKKAPGRPSEAPGAL